MIFHTNETSLMEELGKLLTLINPPLQAEDFVVVSHFSSLASHRLVTLSRALM